MPGFDDLHVAVNQQRRIGVAQHPHQVVGIALVAVGVLPVQFLDHPGDRVVGVGNLGAETNQMISPMSTVTLDGLDDQGEPRKCPG